MGKYIFGAIVIIIIILVFVFYRKPSDSVPPRQGEASNSAESGASATASVIDTGSTVGSGVGNTNPFGVDVNPVSGYKNPFAK